MTIEWQNRGINMWTIEQGSITLAPGLSTYPLPADTIDLLEHVIRTGQGTVSTQADINISRISVSTYSTIPNKLQQARPIQLMVQRMSGNTATSTLKLSGAIDDTTTSITLDSVVGLAASGYITLGAETIFYSYISGNTLTTCFRGQNGTTAAPHADLASVSVPQLPAVTVWPLPDTTSTYTLVYWRLRRVQDAGNGAEIADMNFRFLPAVVAGLAYHIAMKVPELQPRIEMLKMAYEEQFELAASEDREKAPLRLVARISRI